MPPVPPAVPPVAPVLPPAELLPIEPDVAPEVLPGAFPGTVIEILEANHLFKRETRPRAGLNGANAGSAYGDDTPMADLTPLATWLKTLK